MAKFKNTKNELKAQRDSLRRYERYLPTLQLKKQQLQLEVRQVEHRLDECRRREEQLLAGNSVQPREIVEGADIARDGLGELGKLRGVQSQSLEPRVQAHQVSARVLTEGGPDRTDGRIRGRVEELVIRPGEGRRS